MAPSPPHPPLPQTTHAGQPGVDVAVDAGTGTGAHVEDELIIRRLLLAAMLENTRTALAGNVAIGLTTAAVLHLAGNGGPGLWLWVAAIAVLVVLRARHAMRLKPRVQALDDVPLRRAERQITALLAAQGAVWGALPWLGYGGADPFVDFFTVAMLVGMTAGAVNSASSQPRALNAYIMLALLPFAVRAVGLGGLVNVAGALTIVFSALVLFAFARGAYRATRATLVVTRQNARLAEALRQERDAVQATLRAKDLFLAGVTHDLRQPVHALGLHLRYLRSLRQDELAPETIETLCAPMDSALRTMSGQLTRLLSLSRLEAGEVKPQRRWFLLADLFSAIEAQFAVQAREKGLSLRLRPVAMAVFSDPQMLQSIVDNLVSNALRYTDDGGVLVAARHRADAVELAIYDTGVGIAGELIPQLFTPYRRFDDRDRSGDPGQGLGLALVHKQAALLDHALNVRSVPGRGSCFAVSLSPVQPADAVRP